MIWFRVDTWKSLCSSTDAPCDPEGVIWLGNRNWKSLCPSPGAPFDPEDLDEVASPAQGRSHRKTGVPASHAQWIEI